MGNSNAAVNSPLLPPSLDQVAEMAETALQQIPEELRAMVSGVILRVDDYPDESVVAEMGLSSPFEILGLYSGIPFGEQDGGVLITQPDMIFLYRRPILDYWCETGEDLVRVIRHVLVHEIGHHFGLSDDDMEALEMEDGFSLASKDGPGRQLI